jgi:hypothetical protein
MKARNENGIIKIYPTVPNIWNNFLNFAQADAAILHAEGFYDLHQPVINSVTQKLGEIYFDEEYGAYTYAVIEKTQAEIDYEAAIEGWHHPEFELRIVAPDILLIQAPGVETWARYNGLPVVAQNGMVYLYCDMILPQHEGLLIAYQNVINIENRPI